MSEEPAMMQNGIPKPRIHRATTYMAATLCQSRSTKARGEGTPTIDREGLDAGSCHHDPTSYKDSPSSSKGIIDIRYKWQ